LSNFVHATNDATAALNRQPWWSVRVACICQRCT